MSKVIGIIKMRDILKAFKYINTPIKVDLRPYIENYHENISDKISLKINFEEELEVKNSVIFFYGKLVVVFSRNNKKIVDSQLVLDQISRQYISRAGRNVRDCEMFFDDAKVSEDKLKTWHNIEKTLLLKGVEFKF